VGGGWGKKMDNMAGPCVGAIESPGQLHVRGTRAPEGGPPAGLGSAATKTQRKPISAGGREEGIKGRARRVRKDRKLDRVDTGITICSAWRERESTVLLLVSIPRGIPQCRLGLTLY
jgi:hypothetical protein